MKEIWVLQCNSLRGNTVTKARTLEKGQNWIQIAACYSLAAGIWPAEPLTLCEPVLCRALRVQLSNVYNILGTHGINFSSIDVLMAILLYFPFSLSFLTI